jgi:hypothetical protein
MSERTVVAAADRSARDVERDVEAALARPASDA